MFKKLTSKFFIAICLLLFSNVLLAQKTITGTINDESTSQPVVGATVAARGTRAATQTTSDGSFSLSVPNGATRLTVTSVGYAPQDISISGRTNIAVSLKASNTQLSEVVVTALGIKKEKKALGYSLTEVKGDELTQARSVNIANSLAGKVAGLNITSTATGPGGSTRITIRGNASINGKNQPLIVVDGIPFNNENLGSVGEWGGQDQGDGISSLNPDEIESISVLKGGTAAALYGSRASNGAILVTTKSGSKSGKAPAIEVSSNFESEDILYKKIKDFQYVYGTGDKGTGLVGVKPTSADPNLNQTNSWGAKLDGSSVIQYDGISRPYSAVKDNFSKFYNTGATFTNTFAVSGGSDKITYRFSFSDLNNKGIVPLNTLVRDNTAININANLSKRFSVLVNGKYIREKNKNRPRVSDSPGSANYTIWTMPTSLSVETMKGSKYNTDGSEKIWSNNQYVQNPYFALEDYKETDVKDRIIGVVEPRFNITDWLYIRGRAGFDKFNRNENDHTPTGTGYQLGGSINTNLRDFRETNLELLLGVDKKITSSIDVNAVVGGNRMKQVTITEAFGGGPFNIPFFYDISNVSTPSRYTNNGYAEKRINSLYGSADFSFKNFLYLNLTGRNDWFSTLAPDRNSLFYPSVGLSFILSDALQMPAFVNYAKLRGSWAKTGGDTDPYKLSLTYALTGATQGAPLAQVNQSQVPNALLQPYEVKSWEVGLEGRLLNNRLGLDFAYYDRKTTNDIVGATISPSSGYTSALFNIGEITNKGIELLLSYKVGTAPNFSWEPSFNISYNKSTVVQIYKDLDKYFVEEPRPRSSGIYQVINKPFAQILGNGFKRDPKSSQVIFNDQGLPETEGLKSFGSGISPWTLGFTNSFRYKQFGLSFLVDAKYGGYIFSGTNALAYRYGLQKETLAGRETGVVGQGITEAGTPNTVVVAAQTYYSNLYNFAEPFVYSSDFIKLRQVIFDYSVPARVFGKTPFKAVTISLVGRNLWTIMKHTPVIDPESSYSNNNAQGQEFAGLPATRTMGVNLNLRF
jgi:TonB-linked SusC/RagA family outer membrane protein